MGTTLLTSYLAFQIKSPRLPLKGVLGINSAQSRVILTGIFYRKHIKNDVIDEANGKLEKLSQNLNRDLRAERIVWLPRPADVQTGYLRGCLHLEKYGYRKWTKVLQPKMMELLKQLIPGSTSSAAEKSTDAGAKSTGDMGSSNDAARN